MLQQPICVLLCNAWQTRSFGCMQAIQSLLQILALQLLGQATLSNKQARAHNSQPAGLVS